MPLGAWAAPSDISAEQPRSEMGWTLLRCSGTVPDAAAPKAPEMIRTVRLLRQANIPLGLHSYMRQCLSFRGHTSWMFQKPCESHLAKYPACSASRRRSHRSRKCAFVSTKKSKFPIPRLLCQCRRMAKAYRADVITNPKFQAELGKSRNTPGSGLVRCPVSGCECSYEMYGSQPSSRDRDITTLRERIEREHPGHTSEVLAVNAFRRGPR